MRSRRLVAVLLMLGCSGGLPPDPNESCRTDAKEVALAETTPLGFSAQQALDVATRSFAVDLRMGQWPATKLNIDIKHDGGPVYYLPPEPPSRPGPQLGRLCSDGVHAKMILTLRSDDGKINLSQVADLEAASLEGARVKQKLIVMAKGDTRNLGTATPRATGTFDYPPEFADGKEALVVETVIGRSTGSVSLFGSYSGNGVFGLAPVATLAKW
jgi:hypothetical protein